MPRFSYSLSEIASFLDVTLDGDPSAVITGIGTLASSGPDDLAFLSNPIYASQLSSCEAGVVILHPDQAESFNGNRLICEDPYLCYAKISHWFDPVPDLLPEIAPSATVDPSAKIGDRVHLGANVVIGANVQIGSGCRVGANCSIGENSVLGADCRIASNVAVYHGVRIGSCVTVHSGSVLGADGFGFAPDSSLGWQKISQLGGVCIGSNVEIGACTTIDRGAIEDTVIGNNVIIDNHVQIAHNARVGDNTAMAAYSGVAGSASLGKNCILAGGAHVVGHVDICDNVQIMAHTLITKDINKPGSYSSASMPLMTTSKWRKNAVRVSQLNDIALRVQQLEQKNNSD